MYSRMKKAKLVLEDGSFYDGYSFGADKSISGEVVFNTGMVGYPESMTDASYRGQILVLTYPLVGNYGVPKNQPDNETNLSENFESENIHIRGVIISDYSKEFNHWKARASLGDWLNEQSIPGIYGIDTRALTKKIREKGVMLGKIIVEDCGEVAIEDPNKKNLVAEVSTKEVKEYGQGDKTIILIDCGVKNNIIRSLIKKGLKVIRVPWDYDFFHLQFDGIFLSNGPGDPKMCTPTINNLKKAIEKNIPIFGICLGHQLLALAAGADTFKMKYGHRAQNQPCQEVGTKKCFITSQNHGFAVDETKLPEAWKPWFRNANDNTNEGIIHENGLFAGAQFHPEGQAGPEDTGFIFDMFVKALEKKEEVGNDKNF